MRLFLLIIFIGYFLNLFSQEKVLDSSYIGNFSKSNSIELYSGRYDNQLNLLNPTKKKFSYILSPNVGLYSGFYASYKWLTLMYSWNIPGTVRLKNEKKMTSSDLTLFRFFRSWGLTIDKNSTHGLILKERKNSNNPLPIRNLKLLTLNSDIYFFQNKNKFSYKASQYLAEIQKKSAGSLIGVISPNYNQIRSTTIIPTQINNSFLFKNPSWFSLTTSLGYSYNYVLNSGKFIINPSLFLGYGLIKSPHTLRKLKSEDGLNFSFNSGYSGDLNYFLLNGSIHFYNKKIISDIVHQTKSDISITYGHRFNNLNKKILTLL
jgi:hypothetical protein